MESFRYADSPFPIREDLVEANRSTWRRIAAPGSWWTGEERVAIADAVRGAIGCALCEERKTALSPNHVQGRHDGEPSCLADAAVDAVHRIVNDQSRLSGEWVRSLEEHGITDGHYVELLGVVVSTISIDRFHRALGLLPEPLPDPEAGQPDGYRPTGVGDGGAYVPMLMPGSIAQAEKELFPPIGVPPNVLRALSLVPDAVRSLNEQSGAYYLSVADIGDPSADGPRAINRKQIELLAARVSLLNECFY